MGVVDWYCQSGKEGTVKEMTGASCPTKWVKDLGFFSEVTPSEILIIFGDWNVMTLRGSGWVVFPIWGADNLHALFFIF